MNWEIVAKTITEAMVPTGFKSPIPTAKLQMVAAANSLIEAFEKEAAARKEVEAICLEVGKCLKCQPFLEQLQYQRDRYCTIKTGEIFPSHRFNGLSREEGWDQAWKEAEVELAALQARL